MAEKAFSSFDPYSGTPAANDLFLMTDVDFTGTEKTHNITYSNLISGLQPASSDLSGLASDLPSITGLLYWNGGTEDASQIVAGDGIVIGASDISINIAGDSGISITGTSLKTISLSKFGLGALGDPTSESLLLISSLGLSSFLEAGSGISFSGGSISLSKLGLETLSDPNADRIMFWDDSEDSLKWLTIGADAGLAINSSGQLVHAPEPVVVSLRAVEGTTDLEAGVATYWTVPEELNLATISNVDIAFVNLSGSATVAVDRAPKGTPTNFANILTQNPIVTSGYSTFETGQTRGTSSSTLATGDRLRITLSGLSTTAPQGLDVIFGLEV
jgi:hypothetical protein